LAFYEGLTLEELEERIFDLELIYTRFWEIELEAGKQADLGDAVDRDDGTVFAGFESAQAGTWLLALTCSTCQHPAPILLTVVEPLEAEGP
jgi:hypothetical protein